MVPRAVTAALPARLRDASPRRPPRQARSRLSRSSSPPAPTASDSGTARSGPSHLAWSGEQQYLAERLPEGAGAFSSILGAGEDLHPGEIILEDGDRYDAPTALFIWSDRGLDAISDRLHRRLRARPAHPRGPRPLVLNTWEAVYFDHDLAG